MRTSLSLALGASFAIFLGGQAYANPCPPGNPPTNCAAPAGAILDLNDLPINSSYQEYTVSFVATDTNTNISFAIREDPSYINLDDIAVNDTTTSGANLIQNGGFESGDLTDWVYLNTFGATFGGYVYAGNPNSGAYSFIDGSVQAYDGITQEIATTIGDTYEISFFESDDSGIDGDYSDLSTNGDVSDPNGNGIDLLVYAGAVPTLPVPEPASLLLFASGLLGLGMIRRRRSS